MGFLHKFFQINRIIPKRHGLGTGGVICLHHFIFTVYQPHPLPPPPIEAFNMTDSLFHYRCIPPLRHFATAVPYRDYRNACGNPLRLRAAILSPIASIVSAAGPIKMIPPLCTGGQNQHSRTKTITGMNGIGMMLPCSFNDIIYIQITFFGSGRPYQTGFVCIHHMTRRTVGFRKTATVRIPSLCKSA